MTQWEWKMARKKALVAEREQFIVRMPAGMRDRIRAKAERAGMSMNDAIVWCLEQHFPAPVTIEERLEDLAELVAVMKSAGPDYPQIDAIYNELRETLDGVSKNKIEASQTFAQMVWERLHDLDIADAEDAEDRSVSPFDDGHDLDED